MARAETNGSDTGVVRIAQVVGGLIALLLYAWFVYYLVDNAASADKQTWKRLTPIYATISTIAVGAAGAAFGNHVQKKRADRADRRADEKSNEADRGRALAAALKAEGGGRTRAELETLGVAGGPGEVVARHAALARELFPDTS